MLQGIVYHKLLPFDTVLMDSWYATNNLMQYIEVLSKYYYCPFKRNRLVDDTEEREKDKSIEALEWSECQQEKGKIIKIKAFPKNKKVKLFRGKSLYRQNGIHCY